MAWSGDVDRVTLMSLCDEIGALGHVLPCESWGKIADICEWLGVKIDGGQVSRLVLRAKHLKGM